MFNFVCVWLREGSSAFYRREIRSEVFPSGTTKVQKHEVIYHAWHWFHIDLYQE